MTIGQQIVIRRKALGLAQKAVAKRAGIDPSHLSLIEHDKRDPSLRVLNRIAYAVGSRVFTKWETGT